jgi:hypothetical protein
VSLTQIIKGMLGTKSVDTQAIDDKAVGTGQLADGAVGTTQLADGGVTPAKLAQKLTQATAVTASGTAVDFTGIPPWAKRITISLSGISLSGVANILFQVGAGSIQTTGYLGNTTTFAGGASQTYSTGFTTVNNAAANLAHGAVVLTNISGNTWGMTMMLGLSNTGAGWMGAGSVTLTGALDRVRISSGNGTDTFDAGSFNILYEG